MKARSHVGNLKNDHNLSSVLAMVGPHSTLRRGHTCEYCITSVSITPTWRNQTAYTPDADAPRTCLTTTLLPIWCLTPEPSLTRPDPSPSPLFTRPHPSAHPLYIRPATCTQGGGQGGPLLSILAETSVPAVAVHSMSSRYTPGIPPVGSQRYVPSSGILIVRSRRQVPSSGIPPVGSQR